MLAKRPCISPRATSNRNNTLNAIGYAYRGTADVTCSIGLTAIVRLGSTRLPRAAAPDAAAKFRPLLPIKKYRLRVVRCIHSNCTALDNGARIGSKRQACPLPDLLPIQQASPEGLLIDDRAQDLL